MQAANNAADSVILMRLQAVCWIVSMAGDHRAIRGTESRGIFFTRFRTRLRLKRIAPPAWRPALLASMIDRGCNPALPLALGIVCGAQHALCAFQP